MMVEGWTACGRMSSDSWCAAESFLYHLDDKDKATSSEARAWVVLVALSPRLRV